MLVERELTVEVVFDIGDLDRFIRGNGLVLGESEFGVRQLYASQGGGEGGRVVDGEALVGDNVTLVL